MADSQAVEDLLWVLNSPSLVTGPDTANPISISSDQVDPIALDDFMSSQTGHRVGRRFEALLGFWLEHIRKVELVGSGIQVRDGNRTVGEIDFLFRDEDGRLNHWEVAVKFFLHYANVVGSHFPGPNAADNFERKTLQLFDKQLRLSEIYYPEVTVRKAFVKGRIFNHIGGSLPQTLPNRMAADHLGGKWLYASEVEFLAEPEGFGHIVAKPYWLAPVVGATRVAGGELVQELGRHFAESDHPVMVSIADSAGVETERLFVVPGSWPAGV